FMFRLVCPRTAQGARSAGPGWSVPEELVPPRRTHFFETEAEFAATVIPSLPVVHLVGLRKLQLALTGVDFIGQALARTLVFEHVRERDEDEEHQGGEAQGHQ